MQLLMIAVNRLLYNIFIVYIMPEYSCVNETRVWHEWDEELNIHDEIMNNC